MGVFLICLGVFMVAFLSVGAYVNDRLGRDDNAWRAAVIVALPAATLITGFVAWAFGA